MLIWAFVFLGVGVLFFVVMSFAEKTVERKARRKAQAREVPGDTEKDFDDGHDV